MEENNKKSNKLAIIGIILIVLGVGLFVVNKFVLGEDEKEEQKETKTIDEQNLELYPYYIVVTARYGATQETKDFISKIFGDNAEEKFRVYFQWYNVVHELTHGIVAYNTNINRLERDIKYGKEGYLEEQKVNDFAVAYWKKYGDQEKVKLLKETVDYIVSNMKDPTDGKLTIEEYGKQLWQSDNPDSSFEEYGWFQFNSVKMAFEKDLTVEQALKNLGVTKEVKLDEEKLSYDKIDETVCDKVISDTVAKFKKWGLNFTEIYHVYNDDPNTNYSKAITKGQYESLKSGN
jgi:hypothetical protein